MKNALNALILSLVAFSLVSCCTTCGKKAKPAVAEVAPVAESYGKNVSYGKNAVIPVPVPVAVEQVAVADTTCPKCTERFDPSNACCGSVSDAVAQRATTQGWDGNPFIGLVPTMKPLAE